MRQERIPSLRETRLIKKLQFKKGQLKCHYLGNLSVSLSLSLSLDLGFSNFGDDTVP